MIARRNVAFSIVLALGLCSVACVRDAAYYQKRADDFYKKRDYEAAALNYRNAIKQDPAFGPAYFGIGECQFATGKIGEAAASLSRAVDLMPNNVNAIVELTDVTLSEYVLRGRPESLYNRVTQLTRDILARYPESADGARLQGLLDVGDHRYSEAVTALETANAKRKSDPAIVLPLAEALAGVGKAAESEQAVYALIQQHPDYGPAYDWLVKHYLSASKPAEAEQVLQQKIKTHPRDSSVILQLAEFYQRQNRPVEVKKTIDSIATNGADFKNPYLLAGMFYQSQGNLAEAARFYNDGLTKDSPKLMYQKALARVYGAQGKVPEALAMANAALKDSPKDTECLTLRASLLLDRGQPEGVDQAIADGLKVMEQRPQDSAVRFLLGRAYLKKGDLEPAKIHFNEAAKLDSRLVEPRIGLAEIALMQNDFNSASRNSSDALRINPRNARAQLQHAIAARGLGDLQTARRELNTLAIEHPNAPDVTIELGLLEMSDKHLDAALRMFLSTLAAQPQNHRALGGAASVYVAQQKPEQAIQLLLAALAKEPDSAELAQSVADVALQAKRLDLAYDHYSALAKAHPDSALYQQRLAQVYEARGDKLKAIEAYQNAQRLAPANAAITGSLAILRQNEGDFHEAGAAYQRSVELNPVDPVLLNNRAYFLAESGGNLDEGIRLVQSALQKMPGNEALLDTLAWLYVKKNMNDSAIQILDALVKKSPQEPSFRYHLGTALLQKGDKQGARRELTAALENRPSQADAAKIKNLIDRIAL